MHSPETRQKFIELRADAHSIPHIASLLGVAQSTLRLWEKDDALEIAHLRCSYWQDAEDKVGITIEHRLRRMAEWIKGAEDELEKRHFDPRKTEATQNPDRTLLGHDEMAVALGRRAAKTLCAKPAARVASRVSVLNRRIKSKQHSWRGRKRMVMPLLCGRLGG